MAAAKQTLIAAAVLVACNLAAAQSLANESPVNRVLEVAQFGLPSDAKFIFCEGWDCPDRTVKTLTSPQPIVRPAKPAPPVLLPQPQSVQPPAELSPAKPPVKKTIKKKPAPKKRAPRIDCGPDLKK